MPAGRRAKYWREEGREREGARWGLGGSTRTEDHRPPSATDACTLQQSLRPLAPGGNPHRGPEHDCRSPEPALPAASTSGAVWVMAQDSAPPTPHSDNSRGDKMAARHPAGSRATGEQGPAAAPSGSANNTSAPLELGLRRAQPLKK